MQSYFHDAPNIASALICAGGSHRNRFAHRAPKRWQRRALGCRGKAWGWGSGKSAPRRVHYTLMTPRVQLRRRQESHLPVGEVAPTHPQPPLQMHLLPPPRTEGAPTYRKPPKHPCDSAHRHTHAPIHHEGTGTDLEATSPRRSGAPVAWALRMGLTAGSLTKVVEQEST